MDQELNQELAHSDPMTSHALEEQMGSRQKQPIWMLWLPWKWRQIINPALSVNMSAKFHRFHPDIDLKHVI